MPPCGTIGEAPLHMKCGRRLRAAIDLKMLPRKSSLRTAPPTFQES